MAVVGMLKWWACLARCRLMLLRGSMSSDRSRTPSTQVGVPLCRSSVARFLFLMQCRETGTGDGSP
ncbi:hypothetical protein CCHR01_19514 [Colletotrichum chrysophilum]|uniref:Secreted protein n=1 Tax=Colletotrichum chrysophilum TaxID=1836956 RepID=A0AAD9A0E7_9PEZI|nr:hypothetical protein CCHR01_19514 [Colletotrichum chrysophilum]